MTDEERQFFAAVGLRAVDRAAAMWRALVARFGAEEADRIDAKLETPAQFLRLEALLYEQEQPPLAQVRAALAGTYTPRARPPIHEAPGATVRVETAPPQAAPAAPAVAPADAAWRAEREAELRAKMGQPGYFQGTDRALVAEVQAGWEALDAGRAA